MNRLEEQRCPRTGRLLGAKSTRPGGAEVPSTRAYSLAAIALGILATLWFLVRVLPKPSRAAYPCQQVAAPTAAAFVVWLLGVGGFATLLRKSLYERSRSRPLATLGCVAALVGGATWLLLAQPAVPAAAYTTWTPLEGPNAPMGNARGIFPGRVAWAFDPSATKWDGTENSHWWDPAAADQVRVDWLLSQAVKGVAGKTTDGEAWAAIFASFNQQRGRGAVGYQAGETLVVKINQNTARGGHGQNGLPNGSQNPINGDPHVILSVVRGLVNSAKVPQGAIYVYDISRYIPDSIYSYVHTEFPSVHFVEQSGAPAAEGREAVPPDNQWTQNAVVYSVGTDKTPLPQFVTSASYMINLASLKAHGDAAGPTLHAKNHYGSIRGLRHDWDTVNGTGKYSWFVDLMGSKYLGSNTLLFIIDAIYGAPGSDAKPARWALYPFGGNWPSSLFVSQDGVASESVGWDFINTEWGNPPGCDNTLHEAATADNPASGTFYKPNGDGVRLPSLGVHEHWNNPIEKKYSRNLGKGVGIELYPIFAPDAAIPLPHNGWVASASLGANANNAIDGSVNTRWTTNAAQVAGQWFMVDMQTPQKFGAISIDANGTDTPAAYRVEVSTDGMDWGTAVATGTGAGGKQTISFATQTARYVRITQTGSMGNWWSIAEFNVIAPAGVPVVVPPLGGSGSTAGTGGTSAGSAAGMGSGTAGGKATDGGVGNGGVLGSGGGNATTGGGVPSGNGAGSPGVQSPIAGTGPIGPADGFGGARGGTVSVGRAPSAAGETGGKDPSQATTAANQSQCGCSVGAPTGPRPWLLLLAMAAIATAFRRRRR